MNFKKSNFKVLALLLLALLAPVALVGCGNKDKETGQGPQDPVETIQIAFASCCVTEDVTVAKIVPAFEKYWSEKTGKPIKVIPTFAGSGTLTNNIIGGNDIQLGLLSSESYGYQLQEKGLSSTNWREYPSSGEVIKSVMVMLVREGNPKGLKSFEDLAKPGVEVIHSSPDTSGGAQWAIYGMYGSILKETEAATGVRDEAKAFEVLQGIQKNVIAMPESSKQAAAQFDAGQGDVLVTYENEALLELEKGKKYEIVVPNSTVETGWVVIKIDANIKEGQKEVVEEFINFLYSDQVQEYYGEYGYRPSNPDITARFDKFATVALPFNLDYLGGTKEAKAKVIEDLWKKTQQR